MIRAAIRLPTDAERRAWSPETGRAVLTDRLPPPQLSASLVPAETAGLWTVTVSNDGIVDAGRLLNRERRWLNY